MGPPNTTGDDAYGVSFITISHPAQLRQRDTQKAIRRRVMRDIGKSRRKRSRPITVDLVVPPAVASREVPESAPKIDTVDRRRPLNPHIAKTLQPYGHYAVDPDARARQLFHFMTGSVGELYRPFRLEWFATAIADRCSFYLCLANGAMFYHRMTEGGSYEYSDYEESANYFSRCTRLLARRLDCPKDGVSEGVINTVLGFLCHDAAVGKFDRWLTHIAGLRQLVQLRQGFSGLSSLTHMFAFWFELTGCAILDTVPQFEIPPGLPQASVSSCKLSPTLTKIIANLATSDSPHLLEACGSLEQTALVAGLCNENSDNSRFWESGMEAARVLGPAAHYSLSMPRMPFSNSESACTAADVLCEMVRLATLMLIAGLKRAFSLAAGEMVPLQRKFEGILPLVPRAMELCPKLGLWCVVIVACSQDQGVSASLACTIREAMATMAISTASEAIELAKTVIWVERIFALKTETFSLDIDNGLPMGGSAINPTTLSTECATTTAPTG